MKYELKMYAHVNVIDMIKTLVRGFMIQNIHETVI
jgi:hypothetical protein